MADRSVTVRLRANIADYTRGMSRAARDTDLLNTRLAGTEVAAKRGEASIDKFSGRLRLFTDLAATIGPTLIPLSAAAVPAIAGLAASFGAAAGAAGVAILAFNGVGDALKAIDAYQLAPTTENLAKMRQQLDALGPAGAQFARYLDTLDPKLQMLKETARGGMFPGVEEGINDLLTMLPQVNTIVGEIARGMGDLTADAGAGLAGPGFADFFDYLETDARPTLEAFGHTIGNITEGLAHLTVAFAPLTRDFTGGMEDMTASFADWAAGLSNTEGFRDFVDYVRESGPQAIELLGSLGEMFVAIAEAAAPWGSVMLPALTALADILGAIAASPIGPPLFAAVAGMIAVNRASQMLTRTMATLRTNALLANGELTKLGRVTAMTGGLIGVGMAVGAIADSVDRIDVGTLDRSLEALSNGEVTGNIDQIIESLSWLTDPSNSVDLGEFITGFGLFGDSTMDKMAQNVDALDQKLAQLVETGEKAAAADLFAQITDLAAAQGISPEDLAGEFDDYELSLRNAAAAGDDMAGSNRRVGASAGLTKEQVQALTDAMEEQRQEALGAFDAVTRYAEALDAARKRAEKTNAGLSETTKEGRKNRDVLSQMASAWNNQGDKVRDNIAKYAEARSALVQVATQMGATRGEAEKYADTLLDLPKFIATRIEAYTGTAQSAIQGILTQLASIPREIRTRYYVTQVNAVNVQAGGGRDGDPSTPYAGGGQVRGPGGPRDDLIPARLSNREWVMPVSSVDYYGPDFMAAVQARRFADGGTPSKQYRSANGGFNLTASMSSGEVRRELRDFAKAIHDAKGELGKSFDHLGKQAVLLTERYNAAQDRIADLRDLRSTVAGSFMNDALGGSLSEFDTQVNADRNDARKMKIALRRAARHGLDGRLFEDLAAEGNLQLAQQFAGLSRGQIRRREQAYGARNAAGQALAGEVMRVAGMPELIRETKHMRQRMEHLEQRIERGVRRGAYDGTSQREKDRDRETANRSRTR